METWTFWEALLNIIGTLFLYVVIPLVLLLAVASVVLKVVLGVSVLTYISTRSVIQPNKDPNSLKPYPQKLPLAWHIVIILVTFCITFLVIAGVPYGLYRIWKLPYVHVVDDSDFLLTQDDFKALAEIPLPAGARLIPWPEQNREVPLGKGLFNRHPKNAMLVAPCHVLDSLKLHMARLCRQPGVGMDYWYAIMPESIDAHVRPNDSLVLAAQGLSFKLRRIDRQGKEYYVRFGTADTDTAGITMEFTPSQY